MRRASTLGLSFVAAVAMVGCGSGSSSTGTTATTSSATTVPTTVEQSTTTTAVSAPSSTLPAGGTSTTVAAAATTVVTVAPKPAKPVVSDAAVLDIERQLDEIDQLLNDLAAELNSD